MPATKAKSKQKRTLRHKRCEGLLVMLDVMAKALERANSAFELRGALLEATNIQLARKSSVIRVYEQAWLKARPRPYLDFVQEPHINGRCAK